MKPGNKLRIGAEAQSLLIDNMRGFIVQIKKCSVASPASDKCSRCCEKSGSLLYIDHDDWNITDTGWCLGSTIIFKIINRKEKDNESNTNIETT